ncbi:MAG: hypothetical protein OEZ36_08425 [Spirochaetota bacterium]|nr:hypothetical protein [Spirochaetota bacterium]
MIRKTCSALGMVLAVILLSQMFSACGPSKIHEKENNNSMQKANEIESDSIVIGKLNSPGDRDFYVLQGLNQKGVRNIVTINLEKLKGFDLKIEIYEGLKLIKIIDDNQLNQGERMENLLVGPGTYYIVVSAGELNQIFGKEKNRAFGSNSYPSEEYRMTITSKEEDYRESEANDHAKDAIPLEIGKSITGYYSPFLDKAKNNDKMNDKLLHEEALRLKVYDSDWYLFEVDKSGRHYLSIVLSGTKDVDSVLAVYQDKALVFMNSKGRGEEERVANLTVKGKTKYYIQVIGVPKAFNERSNDSYPYELTVKHLAKHEVQTEAENNNSVEESNLIKDKNIHGLLSPATDVDYYRVAVNAEIVAEKENDKSKEKVIDWEKKEKRPDKPKLKPSIALSATLRSVPNLDLQLRLLDEKGKVLRVYDDNGVGKDETITQYDVSGYNYVYLAVLGGKENKGDNFKEMYELNVELGTPAKNLELEPNDGKKGSGGANGESDEGKPKEEMNFLVPNRRVQGFISPKAYKDRIYRADGDVDIYEIRMNQKKKYRLELTGINGVHLKLMIYEDSNNITIPLAGFREISLRKKATIVRYIRPTPKAHSDSHIYRIKVWSKFGKTSSSTMPYTLRVKEY